MKIESDPANEVFELLVSFTLIPAPLKTPKAYVKEGDLKRAPLACMPMSRS